MTRVVDGEVVILDQPGETVHQLNATASYIWSACIGGQSAADIAARLATRFDDVPETAAADVLATLEEFRRLGLLADDAARGLRPGARNQR